MMTVCCALIAASTFGAKMLSKPDLGAPLHPFQITFGRYVFALMALSIVAAMRPVGRPQAPLTLYAGRTLCGWASATGLFAAAALIPLADATAISFLSPVFVLFLAIAFLGERVGRIRWSAALVALTGGIVLLRPGAGAFEPGALFALGAAVTMAIETVLIKRLTRVEPVLRFLLITNIMGAIIATATAAPFWTPPTTEQWFGLAFVGLTMVTAQLLFTISMKIADASFVTPFFYVTLIFAAVYDAAWFGVLPGPWSAVGAAMILGGAMVLAWREARKA